MAESLRMPVAIASRKGVSGVAAEAADHRVILTSHGRPIAVVDSAERIDEDLRTIREAAHAVVDHFAEQARTSVVSWLDLDATCERLGIDPAEVRRRVRVSEDQHTHALVEG